MTAQEMAIGISYQVSTGNGRQIVMQTAVPLNADKVTRDQVLDTLREMGDRQAAFGQIETLKNEADENASQRQRLIDNINMLDDEHAAARANGNGSDAKSHKDRKLAENEATARANAVKQITYFNKVIAEKQAKQDAIRATLG